MSEIHELKSIFVLKNGSILKFNQNKTFLDSTESSKQDFKINLIIYYVNKA